MRSNPPWRNNRFGFKRRDLVEEPKAHDQLPDSLGIGVHEELMPETGLVIYFSFNPSRYVVLGRYAEPKDDGSLYYVANWASGNILAPAATTRHQHLLTAIAEIHEIKQLFDVLHNKGTDNEDLQD